LDNKEKIMYLIIENKPHEAIRYLGYIKSETLKEKFLKEHKNCSCYKLKPVFKEEKEEEYDLK
jgi:hypothetical protein